MNRTLKFRGYCNSNKCIYDDVIPVGDTFCTSLADDIWHSGEVMQFTGLTDKHGTEIYDFDFYQHNEKMFVVVNSINIGLCAVEINKNLGALLSDLTVNRNHNYRSYVDIRNISKYIEIIGNSFSHHHLLTPSR